MRELCCNKKILRPRRSRVKEKKKPNQFEINILPKKLSSLHQIPLAIFRSGFEKKVENPSSVTSFSFINFTPNGFTFFGSTCLIISTFFRLPQKWDSIAREVSGSGEWLFPFCLSLLNKVQHIFWLEFSYFFNTDWVLLHPLLVCLYDCEWWTKTLAEFSTMRCRRDTTWFWNTGQVCKYR